MSEVVTGVASVRVERIKMLGARKAVADAARGNLENATRCVLYPEAPKDIARAFDYVENAQQCIKALLEMHAELGGRA